MPHNQHTVIRRLGLKYLLSVVTLGAPLCNTQLIDYSEDGLETLFYNFCTFRSKCFLRFIYNVS